MTTSLQISLLRYDRVPSLCSAFENFEKRYINVIIIIIIVIIIVIVIAVLTNAPGNHCH